MFARMLFTGALLFSATQAHAAGDTAPSDKFYLGGGAGQAVYHSDTLDDIDDIEGANVDERDAAYTLFGGYRFNPNFSMEVAYVNLGGGNGQGQRRWSGRVL
ncbi:outer membrane beta-barrel protein [Cobetia marina]|uniref:outer membrane beta-barrel protein n=1 Tax=Cobetia marina TaxID=28258 RepID=UPI00384A8D83